jgi:hypothetical protein
MKPNTMKSNTAFLTGLAAFVLTAGVHTAHAAVTARDAFESTESAVCTVVKRVSIDLSKPLTVSNPIESLSLLPAVCNSRVLSKMEYTDGVRSLLVIGWRVTSASHQVTSLGTNTSTGAAELLVSAVFTLERASATGYTR